MAFNAQQSVLLDSTGAYISSGNPLPISDTATAADYRAESTTTSVAASDAQATLNYH